MSNADSGPHFAATAVAPPARIARRASSRGRRDAAATSRTDQGEDSARETASLVRRLRTEAPPWPGAGSLGRIVPAQDGQALPVGGPRRTLGAWARPGGHRSKDTIRRHLRVSHPRTLALLSPEGPVDPHPLRRRTLPAGRPSAGAPDHSSDNLKADGVEFPVMAGLAGRALLLAKAVTAVGRTSGFAAGAGRRPGLRRRLTELTELALDRLSFHAGG